MSERGSNWPPAKLPESVEWQLVESLYTQTGPLALGGFALATAAVLAWFRSHQVWLLAWALITVLVTIARLVLIVAFYRRGESADRVRVWRRRFVIGALVMGAVMGVTALAFVAPFDVPTRLLLTTIHAVIIMGAVTRNAGCPTAANGFVVLGVTPLFITALASGDSGYTLYSAFVIFQVGAAFGMVRHLYRQTVTLLCTAAENVVLFDEVKRANDELAGANLRLESVAATDSLTGIANRRRFDDVLGTEARRAQHDRDELSLLMIDIDNFKGFNDLYGHQAGDECLRRVAHAAATTLRRPTDLVARYGGEEFIAILPQTSVLSAAALAQEIRASVESLAITNAANMTGTVTVSIGVASFGADGSGQIAHIIRAADQALYRAKDAGRNCVRVAPSERGAFSEAKVESLASAVTLTFG